MDLTNNRDDQGRPIDPVSLDRLVGGPPEYIGTIKIGQTRYNHGSIREMIERTAADNNIDINFTGLGVTERGEFIESVCLLSRWRRTGARSACVLADGKKISKRLYKISKMYSIFILVN